MDVDTLKKDGVSEIPIIFVERTNHKMEEQDSKLILEMKLLSFFVNNLFIIVHDSIFWNAVTTELLDILLIHFCEFWRAVILALKVIQGYVMEPIYE